MLDNLFVDCMTMTVRLTMGWVAIFYLSGGLGWVGSVKS